MIKYLKWLFSKECCSTTKEVEVKSAVIEPVVEALAPAIVEEVSALVAPNPKKKKYYNKKKPAVS